MVEQKYINFIMALLEQTKANLIDWKYLDSQKELCKKMHWMNQPSIYDNLIGNTDPYLNFNKDDSFFMEDTGVYVVIYVIDKEPASLYVIPPTYRKIIHLPADEYGEYITRLLNLVQAQYPSADAYIDSFLNKSVNDKT